VTSIPGDVDAAHSGIISKSRACLDGGALVMISDQSTQAEGPTSAYWLIHPIVALALVLSVYVVPDVLSQWKNSDGDVHCDVTVILLAIFVVGVMMVFIELVGLVVCVVSGVRVYIVQSISHLTALLILGSPILFGRDAQYLVQLVNVYAFQGRYQSCAQSAAEYDRQERFRVCSILGRGNAYTMVVYDSGGQIIGPRSQSFKDFVGLTQTQLLTNCPIAPVNTLRAHFYFTATACQSR
jgi:hypothetical protein